MMFRQFQPMAPGILLAILLVLKAPTTSGWPKRGMCIAGYHSPLILICMPVVASPQFFDDKIIALRKFHGMSFSFVSTCSVKLWCCCRSSWQICEQMNNKWGQTSSIIINNYPTFDSDRQNCSPCPSALELLAMPVATGHDMPWRLNFPTISQCIPGSLTPTCN